MIPNVERWRGTASQVLEALRVADPDRLAMAGNLNLTMENVTDLVLALIQKESSGNPHPVPGDRGCSFGLMQYNWCAHNSTRDETLVPVQTNGGWELQPVGLMLLEDPFNNIALGSRYLLTQILEFADVNHAILAYNAGPGETYRWLTGEIPQPVNASYLATVLSILGLSETSYEDLKKKPWGSALS